MSKLVIISLIVLVLIAGGYYLATKNSSDSTPSTPTIKSNSNAGQSGDTTADATAIDTSSLDLQSNADNLDDTALNDALSSL